MTSGGIIACHKIFTLFVKFKKKHCKIRTDNLLFYYLGWVSFVSFLGIYLVFCFHHLYCHFRNKDKSFIICVYTIQYRAIRRVTALCSKVVLSSVAIKVLRVECAKALPLWIILFFLYAFQINVQFCSNVWMIYLCVVFC